jgi:hypothetical protein
VLHSYKFPNVTTFAQQRERPSASFFSHLPRKQSLAARFGPPGIDGSAVKQDARQLDGHPVFRSALLLALYLVIMASLSSSTGRANLRRRRDRARAVLENIANPRGIDTSRVMHDSSGAATS